MASHSTDQRPAPRDWVYPGQEEPADELVADLDGERPRRKHRPKH